MTLKRAIVVLGLVLTLLSGRTGLADLSSDWSVFRKLVGAGSTMLHAGNVVSIAGTSAEIGQKNPNTGFAIAGLCFGGLGVVFSGIDLGLYSDNQYSLAIGIIAFVSSAASIGTSITHLVLREGFTQLGARVMPTTLTDRDGNMVPGVALQVVGF